MSTFQQLNAFFQKSQIGSDYLFDNGKEIGGISYSTLKHETTVTTDSVLNEERLVQRVNLSDSLDEDNNPRRNLGEDGISIFERSQKTHHKIQDDRLRGIDNQQSFDTTNHIDYYDLFQRNNIISED